MRRLFPVCLAFLLPAAARAQLAITEVHSSQSTNGTVVLKSDWWELTNFAAEPVDISGFRFNDATGGLTASPVPVGPLVLDPGESVVFLEQSAATGIPTADDFRAWWGSGLPPGLRIFTYATNSIGLGSGGDSLFLWSAGAASDEDVADSVEFPAATAGVTFTYDPATGRFGTPSVAGAGGAFEAADGGDVGSPGVTTGTVPLGFETPPADQTANPGDTVTFSVVARGLPRPRYQWQFEGEDLPGETGPGLTLVQVGPGQVGAYRVRLSNGLESLTGEPATLTLNEVPTAPTITRAPEDASVVQGATVTFTAEASGVPAPSYLWTFGEAPIPGADGPVLVLTNVLASQAGAYTVTASNASGSDSATARLEVRTRPDVRITEVHSTTTELEDVDFARRIGFLRAQAECGCPVPDATRVQELAFVMEDWWELTSFEPTPVSLQGWRFDDNSGRLDRAFTFTNEVVLEPGASVVFVENLDAAAFRAWWGTNELLDVPILTYSGSGFGLSSGGDGVRVWDALATENADTIAAVDFGAGTPGVSFNYDPDSGQFGVPSEAGVRGVYQAPGSIDAELGITFLNLGSPGRIRSGGLPPAAPILRIRRDGATVRIAFQAAAGRTYRLRSRESLATGEWTSTGEPLPAAESGEREFIVPSETPATRFFQVAVE